MAILDPIKARPLAVRLISSVDAGLHTELKLKPEQRSLGPITADIDDALYVSIDEATKGRRRSGLCKSFTPAPRTPPGPSSAKSSPCSPAQSREGAGLHPGLL